MLEDLEGSQLTGTVLPNDERLTLEWSDVEQSDVEQSDSAWSDETQPRRRRHSPNRRDDQSASDVPRTQLFSCYASTTVKVRPGPRANTVRTEGGTIQVVPDGWILLPPGDAALTRRVKAAGRHWLVQEKKGRREFSRGVWAPAETIAEVELTLKKEREHPSYAKKQSAAKARREREQQTYIGEFEEAVRQYLQFDSQYKDLEKGIAERVTRHATPVGSGTVARTKRIPIESRAEAAVIAWMRHQTTCYDDMKIPRVKGKRREVRRLLAARSKQLLDHYRRGVKPQPNCPLILALGAS